MQLDLAAEARASAAPLQLHLMGWSAEPLSLETAIRKVQRGRGAHAAGPDGLAPADIEDSTSFCQALSHDMLSQSFTHGPGREVEVPKRSGGIRKIIVQNARSRVADSSVNLYFRSAIDGELPDCSYGFRPGRGAAQALTALGRLMQAGSSSTVLVKMDLAGCFTSVKWSALRSALVRRFNEPELLGFIEDLCGGLYIPQGSPLSPALADFYLAPLLWQVQSIGTGVVYGDDFVVACGSMGEARTVVSSLEAAAAKLWVGFADPKTSVTSMAEGVEFLGYHLSLVDGHARAVARRNARGELVAALERTAGYHRRGDARTMIKALNQVLRGWAEYFHFDWEALNYARRVGEYVALAWLEQRMPRRVVRAYYGGLGHVQADGVALLNPTPFYQDFPADQQRENGPEGPASNTPGYSPHGYSG